MAKFGDLIALFVLIILVAVVVAVGFVAYTIAHDVGHKTRQKLERKNVSFSRDGMKVGVKEVTREQQEDAAQSVITKIWNNSNWPGYQSPIMGWGQASKTPAATPGAEKRNPFSRSSSSAQSVPTLSRHSSNQNNLSRTTSAQVPLSRTSSSQSKS
ncbi:hypothetical protein CLAIMM_09300 [Cladophialophora immunda]|nr:hypothetical protein CLAIMM_09300 [Cladophialophora immunda]